MKWNQHDNGNEIELNQDTGGSLYLVLFFSFQVRDVMERGIQDVSSLGQEEVLIQQAEHRLQFKERQLQSLSEKHLPAVSEERQRAIELLDRVRGGTGSPGLDGSPEDMDKELDETLYQVKFCSVRWPLLCKWTEVVASVFLFFSIGREGAGGEGGAFVSVQRKRRAAAAAPAVLRVHGKRGPSGGEGSQEGEGDPGVEGETAEGGSGAGRRTLGEETLRLPQEPQSGAGCRRAPKEVTVRSRTKHFQVYRNTRPGPGQVC